MIGVLDIDNWREIYGDAAQEQAAHGPHRARRVPGDRDPVVDDRLWSLARERRQAEDGRVRDQRGVRVGTAHDHALRRAARRPADRVRQPRHRGAGPAAGRAPPGAAQPARWFRAGLQRSLWHQDRRVPGVGGLPRVSVRPDAGDARRPVPQPARSRRAAQGRSDRRGRGRAAVRRHRADRHVHRGQRRVLPGRRRVRLQADRRSRPIASLNTIHIPFTTFQQAFNFNDRVSCFAIVGQPGVNGEELEEQVRATLKQRHKIAPDDDNAVGVVEHVQGVREDEHAVLPDQPGDVDRQARCACSPAWSACRTSC